MDIVYILGKGSVWKDNEIRYSLRSIEKHLKDYKNVYIIGECPDFLTNVIHIPCNDYGDKHERNIMEKIKVACNTKEISDNFFFINDDHFLLKDVSCKNYPYYYKGLILDYITVRDFDDYRTALTNTFIELEGKPLNYDIHTPIIYNKKDFLKIMNKFSWENDDYVIKSLYCNSKGVKPVHLEDCKINQRLTTEQILEKLEGRSIFSVGDKALREVIMHYDKNKMRLFLKTNYPNKSKYERTSKTNEDVKSSND